MEQKTVAILMTSHDRRKKTLACLLECFRQIDGMKGLESFSFDIFLVDDGSSDGTAEAVSEKFPQVFLIPGGGNLFWNQGMRLAWDRAAQNRDYDYYLWMNDDVALREGALAAMLENSGFLADKAIIAGTAEDSAGLLSYGGRTKSLRIIRPDDTIPVPCFCFNGNLVLVPRHVFKTVGNLEPRYHHSFGDYDYGIRAAAHGISSVVCPGILCVCDRNHGIPKWRDSRYSLKERYRFLFSPKGRPPREQFLFDTRLMGFMRAVLHMISLNIKVLFPKRLQKQKNLQNE